MRVNLVQLELEYNGGAAGLQALIAAVDRAASGDHEPDVVVLPGGGDVGAGKQTPFVTGRFSTFAETIAWKAREWGMYVVVGLHSNVDGKPSACSFLFDPDGDIVLRNGPEFSGSGAEAKSARWHPSPVGWIGLLGPQTSEPKCPEVVAPRENGLLAISSFPERRSTKTDSTTSPATSGAETTHTGTGLYHGVAGWAGSTGNVAAGNDMPTFLRSPDGKIAAAADAAGDAIVYVDVELPAPTRVADLVDRQAG